MTKIRMLDTREVRVVTPNVAFDLIDGKKAEVYKEEKPVKESRRERYKRKKVYRHRQVRASTRSYRRRTP